jgi:hypothetical protein
LLVIVGPEYMVHAWIITERGQDFPVLQIMENQPNACVEISPRSLVEL